MIELLLTINDKDGRYTEHAGVVLASIFCNTQQKINVHIVHDDTLTEENKAKLTQLVDIFHHNINFYHVSVPGDLQEVASGVHKINYWTIASMYRLLLPLFIQADRVIYLDCDILVNMDINELWSIDLGDRYLGAVLDQGENLLEYFNSLGLNAELYFNSGVILFHLNNIRNKPTWYEEMLNFMRVHPMMTMPDQDVLNAIYSSNYLQLDQRFNTFASSELDMVQKIVHFAGDEKWWDSDSPAAPIYANYLAMTPWGRDPAPVPVYEPEPVSISFEPPPPMPPAEPPAALPEPPAPINPAPEAVVQVPEAVQIPAAAPVPLAVPENIHVKPRRRKPSRLLRLRRLKLKRVRLRLRLKFKKKKMLRAKYRSIKRRKLLKRKLAMKKRAQATKKLRSARKKNKHAVKKVLLKKSSHRTKSTLKRTS
ncbi:glycosyltransferase family 8 protein [Paenibacillus sp. HW567]|uniref:glycosyltransferase family 8 protein n=1 Tax=Paenibacillus sp. HW567 TaxID=1034769 RepID=UPI00035FFC2A|nr:glycosyltransferase family 8 protein [Paenibacillus sp. HW567]